MAGFDEFLVRRKEHGRPRNVFRELGELMHVPLAGEIILRTLIGLDELSAPAPRDGDQASDFRCFRQDLRTLPRLPGDHAGPARSEPPVRPTPAPCLPGPCPPP